MNEQDILLFNDYFNVKEVDKPKSWHLLVQLTAETDAEEAVFMVQGVLVSKDLPPL